MSDLLPKDATRRSRFRHAAARRDLEAGRQRFARRLGEVRHGKRRQPMGRAERRHG